eukprot:CAMPEP_0113428452 /NCGR_PEP_ID=MMETSP0013_2-20120614/31882_1 /TAXON_ID=2843 ORGANISM="Skeletonema costatum, Strain 1716" /NCGR_SAMPLE_ID=MMETSP0013_2 /ASSEMBLY_ACC=CAM_ASM_000158 /LENGTH=77 /DNA_ID=CAMNT_0000317025 /DNA_START=228 /DNA_END=458 /DNA_ORIENTATION=- /assembly_acc=CAM_ASM_000158
MPIEAHLSIPPFAVLFEQVNKCLSPKAGRLRRSKFGTKSLKHLDTLLMTIGLSIIQRPIVPSIEDIHIRSRRTKILH